MIRNFQLHDTAEVVEILKVNNQYDMPEVDGPEAMKRIKLCNAAVFLVCELDDRIIGIIRGVYDGSRAMIHQLSVHPVYQNQGVGTALVKNIIKIFRQQGAPTVSATVMEESMPFWERVGFRRTKAFVVGNWPQ